MSPDEKETHEKEAYEFEGTPEPSPSPAAVPGDDKPSDVKALDVCPNCGASMRPADTLVCMKCGFDLKSMKIVETKVGAKVEDDADEDAEPLVRTRDHDRWLPLTFAGLGVLTLSLGVLAGMRGLFPVADATKIDLGLRLVGLIRYPVLIVITTGCGLAALYTVARIMERPVGTLRTAALRMLGIASVSWMAAFTDVEWQAGEFLLELPIAGGLLTVGVMIMFGLTPSRALTMVGLTVSLFFVVLAGAELVSWLL